MNRSIVALVLVVVFGGSFVGAVGASTVYRVVIQNGVGGLP